MEEKQENISVTIELEKEFTLDYFNDLETIRGKYSDNTPEARQYFTTHFQPSNHNGEKSKIIWIIHEQLIEDGVIQPYISSTYEKLLRVISKIETYEDGRNERIANAIRARKSKSEIYNISQENASLFRQLHKIMKDDTGFFIDRDSNQHRRLEWEYFGKDDTELSDGMSLENADENLLEQFLSVVESFYDEVKNGIR